MNDLIILTEETTAPSVAEIGNVATRALCDRFGGVSREIGKPAQDIMDVIGFEKAVALRDYWGRGRIYIPRRAASLQARHARIKELAKKGITRQNIAHQMQISERQVYNVLAKR